MTICLFTASRIKTLTDAILSDVRAGNEAWPERRGLILVPEDRKLNIERAYLDQADSGNLMMAEVLSFNRLAMRLLSDLGLFNESTLNRRLQAMIMRRLLFEKRDDLLYYRHLYADPEFPDRVNGILREFRQYRVTAADLRTLDPPGKDVAALFHDLALLSEAYEEFMAKANLHDSDSRLLQAILELEQIDREPPERLTPAARQLQLKLEKTAVWIDGYGEHHDFSGLQYRLLSVLEKLCQKITVSMVVRPEDHSRRPGLNLFSRAAGLTLYRRLKERFPLAEVICLDDVRPTAAAPDRLNSAASPAVFTTAKQLFLWEQPDIVDELIATAGEIKRLHEAGLCNFRDVAVVCPVQEVGADRVRRLFEAVGVPIFLKLDSEAVFAEVPKLLLAALDCARNGWQAADVMAWLHSELVCEHRHEADLWETYCLQYGLFGYRLRSERVFRELKEEAGARLSQNKLRGVVAAGDFLWLFRAAYLQPLFDLADRFKKAEDSHAFCHCLLNFMAAFDLEAKVLKRSEKLLVEGAEQPATALVKSWNETLGLLADFLGMAEPVQLTLAEFRHILAAGLEQLSADIIPSTLDQVTVGNTHMALGSRADILFVLAADRDHLPPATPPDSALKASDRLYLAESLGVDLPDLTESKAVWDLFSVEQLRLLPDRRLYLSYSRPGVPAQLLREALAYAEVSCFSDQITSLADPRLYHPAVARLYLLDQSTLTGMEDKQSGVAELAARTYQADPEAWQMALEPFVGSLPGHCKTLQLPEVAADLASKGVVDMSISRLEQYAACPYRYFFGQVLAAEERRVAEPNPRDLGSLNHRILEMAAIRFQTDEDFRQSLKDPAKWPAILAQTRAYVADLIEHDEDYYPFRRPELRQGILTRVAQNTANAIIGYFAALPDRDRKIYTEWDFGFARPEPTGPTAGSGQAAAAAAVSAGGLESEAGGGSGPVLCTSVSTDEGVDQAVKVQFRGYIDRIDVFQDSGGGSESFYLLDYKAKGRQVNLGRICNGLDFQLPIYCAAWQLNNPDQKPAGIGYLALDHDAEVKKKANSANLQETVTRSYRPDLFSGAVISFSELEQVGLEAAGIRLSALLQGDFSVAPKAAGIDIKLNKKGELAETAASRSADSPCAYCGAGGMCRIDIPARNLTVLTKNWPRSEQKKGSETEAAETVENESV